MQLVDGSWVCGSETVIYHNFYILKSHFRIRAKMSESKYNKMANTSTWPPSRKVQRTLERSSHIYAPCQRITHSHFCQANSMKFQPSAWFFSIFSMRSPHIFHLILRPTICLFLFAFAGRVLFFNGWSGTKTFEWPTILWVSRTRSHLDSVLVLVLDFVPCRKCQTEQK